jgi:hypothetical protein
MPKRSTNPRPPEPGAPPWWRGGLVPEWGEAPPQALLEAVEAADGALWAAGVFGEDLPFPVVVRFERLGQGLTMTGLWLGADIRSSPAPGESKLTDGHKPISVRAVRSLRLGRILDALEEEILDERTAAGRETRALIGSVPPADEQFRRRPGRAGRSPEFRAEVLAHYRALRGAGLRNVAERLADEYEVDASTVHRWVRRAKTEESQQ